ncbi:MAG: hypothetical protein QOE95_593, partial [Gaiellaceae bacterium]|nr:hypothetical protein [Gaiellaceae bacterium]
TLATVFPYVRMWPALTLNRLVLGFTAPVEPARLERAPARLRALTALLERQLRPVEPAADPWTDDLAPVEWVTDRMIVEYAARGAGADQRLLPTAPR